MKVLIACEFSGIVRESFKKRGHDAWSCDLLPTEIEGKHYQCDISNVLGLGNNWDLMIAHPPCTYLSNAGARHLYPKGILNLSRLGLALRAKRFFLELLNANIPKICVENPVPSKIIGLPQYDQIIQPYYFGDMVQKKTCLWLKGLKPLEYIKPDNVPQSTKVSGNWFKKGGKDRPKNRSRTFQGIANAMADQWG